MRFVFVISLLFLSQITHSSATTEDFAKLPLFSMPDISPDGESIAFIMTHQDKPVIVTKPLIKKGSQHQTGVIPLDGLQVNYLRWINNERLLVRVRMTVKRRRVGLVNLTRFFSINRDGTKPVFFEMKPNDRGYYAQHPRLINMLESDPNHVLLALDHHDTIWGVSPVHKVNVNTGKKSLVERNEKGFAYMIADNAGDIRIGVRALSGGKKWAMYIKEAAEDSWTLLQKETYDSSNRMRPLRFDYSDDNILLISSKGLEDENFDEDDDDIYRYDVKHRKVLGPYVHTVKTRAKLAIEKAFPKMRVRLVSWLDDKTLDKAIYKIYSDIQPPKYVIYEVQKRAVNYIGSSYPQLEDGKASLSPMLEVSYLARDGLEIPAYLTLPVASKKTEVKPALVVYPHGGPWARDYWGFDNYVQFFSGQGYAVFQPQFRGSEGFGSKHLEAGFKQWGLAIQDDITDGVKWLIREGKVDPNLICIVGSSFGGYAAVMGLVKTPELYKCGVSVNGVLDMKLFHEDLGNLIYAKLNREVVNSEWGVKKVSPYHLRDKIKAPLLLIAGEKDTVVNNKHSKSLYKKLKRKGNTKYLELQRGEHWRTIESNEIVKMQAIGSFLDQFLSRPAP